MLVTGIKSKPVYAPLQADTRGRFHLMLGMGVGAAPLLRVIAEMGTAAPKGLQNTHVLYVPDAGTAAELERFRVAVGNVQAFPSTPALLGEFRSTLGKSLMGTRLYVAGPESFIGLVMKIAL